VTQPASALRSTVVVSIARLFSALLALILGVLSARYFGTSVSKDCYVVAQAIPGLVSTVLLGGIWGTLLVTLAEIGREQGVRGQRAFAAKAFWRLALVLLPVSVIVTLFPGPIVRLAAPGFGAQQVELASSLLRVTLWSVLGIVTFTVVRCLFESRQNFILPTSVSLLMPVLSLVTLVVLIDRVGIFALALGPLLGMIVSIPLLALLARKCLTDPPAFTVQASSFAIEKERHHTFWVAFLPMSIGANCGQINLLVDNGFASYLPTGSITMLGFAFVILANAEQLTIHSLSEVAFPRLIAAGLGSTEELGRTLRTTLRLMILVTAPIATGLMVFGMPLARLLFERGEFPPSSTRVVARLLGWFSWEIVFMGMVLPLSRVLIARKRFSALALIAMGAILANVLLDAVLMRLFGLDGIALATTLVALGQVLVLAPLVRREAGRLSDPDTALYLAKVFGSAALMALLVLAWSFIFEQVLGTSGNLTRALQGLSGLTLGAASYIGLVYALRVSEARDLLNRIAGRWMQSPVTR